MSAARIVLAGPDWIAAARQVRVQSDSLCIVADLESPQALRRAVAGLDTVMIYRTPAFPTERDHRSAYIAGHTLLGAGAASVVVAVGIVEAFHLIAPSVLTLSARSPQ